VSIALISGFRRYVDEICALQGYYAAPCGNCLPTFRDFLTLEDGTYTLSRNVDKQLRKTPLNIPEERKYHFVFMLTLQLVHFKLKKRSLACWVSAVYILLCFTAL
jgi:hypothetical protein